MPKKILLALTRTLGDCLLLNPIARKIKTTYGEDCEITCYVEEQYKELVQYNPDFTEIRTSESWLKNWDVILKDAIKGGYEKTLIPQQLNWEDTIWHQLENLRHQNLYDYYLDRCNLPERNGEVVTFYPGEVYVEIPKQQYFVLHCQSGNPDKDWPYFNALKKRLTARGFDVWQVGSGNDISICDNFFKGTFSEIWEFIKHSKGFVGLDSGLSILAQTTGVDTYVLYGPTIPKTSGPWGRNVVACVSPPCTTCRPIRSHSHCKTTPNCISRLKVDKVWGKIEKRINSTRCTDCI